MNINDPEFLLELNLLDNGIDFILKGIDELFDKKNAILGNSSALRIPSSGYKYGCLHLFSGFLLLLKERLSRHLPELIYKGKLVEVRAKLADQKKQRYLNTVDLDEALERLEIGPKVTFSEIEIGIIRCMQRYRNLFEHFKVSENKYELWSVVSDFLAIVDKFLVNELKINIESSADSIELLHKIEAIESVWKRIKTQKELDWKAHITDKLAEFLVKRAQILDDIVQEQYRTKGDLEPYIICPNCGDETLIVEGEYQGICANDECNATFPITQCVRCYKPTTGFEWEENLCGYCDEWFDREIDKE